LSSLSGLHLINVSWKTWFTIMKFLILIYRYYFASSLPFFVQRKWIKFVENNLSSLNKTQQTSQAPRWTVQPSRVLVQDSWFVRLRTESGRNRIGWLPGRQWFETQSLPVLFSKNVIFINTNRKQFWNELAWSSLSFTSDRKQTYLGN